MVLHLEAGYCESGADCFDVNEAARACYQSKHYTSDDRDFSFECPACSSRFRFMSALLQHAESDTCDEHLGRNRALGKFLHYLPRHIRNL